MWHHVYEVYKMYIVMKLLVEELNNFKHLLSQTIMKV